VRTAALLCSLLLPLAAQTSDPLRKYLARPGFAWQCETLRHFDFCWPPATGQRSVQAASITAERELARMLRIAGAQDYRPRIHLFLLESIRSLQALTGAYAAGASVPGEHAVFIVEEILTTLWGPSEPWVAEGFAAYIAEPDIDAQCRALIASGKARPLEDMVNSWWNASLFPPTVIYPELGSFVKFLCKTYDIARIREVWRGGSGRIARVYGKPLDRLERDWRAALTAVRH
jgi:hypothetical protein